MRKSDRLFGLVVILGALLYIWSASQIQTSFLSDPVGSKTFPTILGVLAALCGLALVLRPAAEPDWPNALTLVNVLVAVGVMVGYAFALKPLGFLIPTAICAGVLSFQIHPRATTAALTGILLSVGLFVLFRYALGLGLQPVPKAWLV